MGLQDRNYYDDQGNDPWSTDPDAWKGGSRRSKRRTVVMVLIIINVVIFLLDAFTPIPADSLANYKSRVADASQADARKLSKPARWLSATMAVKPDVVQKPWNIWQLMTHGFAHASIDSKATFFHVGFNMLVLFFIGRHVESKYGGEEFLRFYLLAIVASGMVWVAAQWIAGDMNTTAVGASGAVSAVLALFIFNYPNEKLYLWGVVGIKAWIMGALFIGLDLLRSLDPESRVAWEAHLAGFAFGAAYFYFGWNFQWLKFSWVNNLFATKPRLKVHHPDAKDEDLQQQADIVLDKIAREGESSLTAKERRILNKYSKSLRKKNG